MKNKSNKIDQLTPEMMGLISWYSTGQLSEEERASVEAMLRENPELNRYLEEEQAIIEMVKEDKSLLDLSALEPTRKRLDNLMSQLDGIEAQPTPQTQTSLNNTSATSTPSLIGWLKGLFEGQQLRYAGYASIVAFVALFVAFVAPLVQQQKESTFIPASEEVKAENITKLIVGVNGNPNNPWLNKFLKQHNARLILIEGKSELYQLRFDKRLTDTETQALLEQLNENKQLIWFAGEAY